MVGWLWGAAAFLLLVAALAIWVDLRDPQFVVGLGAAAMLALYAAIKPYIIAHSPETDAKTKVDTREGTETSTGKAAGHGGENH